MSYMQVTYKTENILRWPIHAAEMHKSLKDCRMQASGQETIWQLMTNANKNQFADRQNTDLKPYTSCKLHYKPKATANPYLRTVPNAPEPMILPMMYFRPSTTILRSPRHL